MQLPEDTYPHPAVCARETRFRQLKLPPFQPCSSEPVPLRPTAEGCSKQFLPSKHKSLPYDLPRSLPSVAAAGIPPCCTDKHYKMICEKDPSVTPRHYNPIFPQTAQRKAEACSSLKELDAALSYPGLEPPSPTGLSLLQVHPGCSTTHSPLCAPEQIPWCLGKGKGLHTSEQEPSTTFPVRLALHTWNTYLYTHMPAYAIAFVTTGFSSFGLVCWRLRAGSMSDPCRQLC